VSSLSFCSCSSIWFNKKIKRIRIKHVGLQISSFFILHLKIMQETRQNKIARMFQKELSLIFQQQTRAMHGVMVSVTRVKVSPDLGVCTAYLSVFPSEKGEEILKNVNANAKTIRFELGSRVRHQVRVIPELRFFIDDSLDYIDRIDELLKQ